MADLDGKVAVITGAGQGLGKVEALEMAKQGARIVANDLGGSPEREEGVHAVVAEIKEMGGEAVAQFGDCASMQNAEALLKTAIDNFGDMNIMVNSAGFCRDGMIFSMSEEEFDSVVRVHLRGHFVNMHQATKFWREKSKADGAPVYGRLISTSSEAFLFGSVGQPNYAAAKAGIVSMTMGAAQAMVKYGVTANVILPRARTAMTLESAAAAYFQPPEGDAFDTFAPENVSPLVTYLASPRAQNISGQLFVVWGKEISLIERPKFGEKFTADDCWTVDGVHDKIAGHFAGLKPVVDGFSVPAQ